MAWNDERLDELSGRMDRGFARVDGEIRDLRTEMREEFRDLRGEMASMRSGFAGVNARIDSLHAMMFRLCVAIMVGMTGLIATLIGSIAAGAL